MNNDLKILIKILIDLNVILISCFISSTISSGQIILLSKSFVLYSILISITIIPIGVYFKVYFDISRYFNFKNVTYILVATLISYVFQVCFIFILKFFDLNFTKTILIFFNYENIFLTHLLFLLIAVNFRLLLRTYLNIKNSNNLNKLKNPCIIFGAGNTGVASIKYIKNVRNFNPIAFIDDDVNKIGRYIENLPIISFSSLDAFKEKNKINKIFLCLPSVSSFKLNEIKQKLQEIKINVEEIKSFDATRVNESNFNFKKNIITNNTNENVNSPFKNKKIIITGAAGTIGEEICYQLINENPSDLILIDKNEVGISNLNQKLNKIDIKSTKIKLILTNLCFRPSIEKIIREVKPDYIFHAAAYKHVEIVEDNPISSVFNNLISLLNVLELTRKQENLKFVFISTDKAVEPVNYMGKSKRLGEILTNSFNFIDKESKNKYCSVRFGNVIGSSGSLIPKIQDQINNNSEITVTNIKATRYFMTINDAVNLTLQAAQLSDNGKIYVLDMGEPINIYELVKKILLNSDRSDLIKKIKVTGLRNGEKLHEKLFYHQNSETTSNKFIFSEKIDKIYSVNEIENMRNKLNYALEKDNIKFLDEIFSSMHS